MKALTYDLHIHSCLSPCGDNDMTPANITGMAALKELDVIAVTDHNSCKNCGPVMKMAENYGITVIPGMELCTAEEVHVLCLFPDLYAAMDFDQYVYHRMTPIPNKENIFGEQLLYNSNDQIIGKEPNLLIMNTSIGFDDVYTLMQEWGGLMIPAHIDKSANSLIANLGFVPPDSQFTCTELKDLSRLRPLSAQNPYLKSCHILSSSDAHYLEHINEPEHRLYAKANTPAAILAALNMHKKVQD